MSVHLEVGDEMLCGDVGRLLSKEWAGRKSVGEISLWDGADSSNCSLGSPFFDANCQQMKRCSREVRRLEVAPTGEVLIVMVGARCRRGPGASDELGVSCVAPSVMVP